MGSPGRPDLVGPYEFKGGLQGIGDADTQKLWQVGMLACYLHGTRSVRAGVPLDQPGVPDSDNFHLAGQDLDRRSLDRLLASTAAGRDSDNHGAH